MQQVVFVHGKESGPWGAKSLALAEVARRCGWRFLSPDLRASSDPDKRVELLLEAVPAETAADVREQGTVPGDGSGAGPQVDGQLVISHDLLGNFVGDVKPRFVRRYADLGSTIEQAFRAYAEDVRSGRFPEPEHCYEIAEAEAAKIRARRLVPAGVAEAR